MGGSVPHTQPDSTQGQQNGVIISILSILYLFSGAVMGSTDDTDSDLEGAVSAPQQPRQQQQRPARRVSAPSILDTVCEDPLTTVAMIHGGSTCSSSSSISSSISRTSQGMQRKLPILPLSPQLPRMKCSRKLALWRSHSLEKLSHSANENQESMSLMRKGTSPSLRKKNFLLPLVRETQFNDPPASDRSRRRGSIHARKVTAIPEDTGILECPEFPDSGRGSVDSGEANKTRANRQISIDEGLGAECLLLLLLLLPLCWLTCVCRVAKYQGHHLGHPHPSHPRGLVCSGSGRPHPEPSYGATGAHSWPFAGPR